MLKTLDGLSRFRIVSYERHDRKDLMLEVKSRFFRNRYFAAKLPWLDIFRAIHYFNYLGDNEKVPWFYSKKIGVSCVSDLTIGIDKIMESMKSNTRNEIRRAIKEGCSFHVDNDIDAFVPYYNDFCRSKGLNDYTSKERILKYKDILSTKVEHNGMVLARHINILDRAGKNAFLMFSCSPRLDENADRRLIGWANKFLHYKDLEWLTNAGFEKYDWSGVCLDKGDVRYSIGQFKLSFGGEITHPLMLKTPLYLFFEKFRWLVMYTRGKIAK